MTKRIPIVAAFAAVALASSAIVGAMATGAVANEPGGGTAIVAGYLSIGMDGTGEVTSLKDKRNGVDHLAQGKRAPLVSLVVDGKQEKPTKVVRKDNVLEFSSDTAGYTVKVGLKDEVTYSTLEVLGVDAPAGADVQTLLWGPLPTNITHTLGETVGVVQDAGFAMGLRPLTDRTEGGWPQEYVDTGWQSEVSKNPGDLEVADLEEWSVGGRTEWGTVLRAFTFDYTKERIRGNRGGYKIPVGPLTGDEAEVIGSKVAVFGAVPDLAPTVLSSIAKDQKLPYLTIDGQWQKAAQATTQSFLVLSDLNTGNLDKASEFAKAAGLSTLYSLRGASGPFTTTGHYEFDSSFGGSDAAAKELAARAAAHGLTLGVHTLSNFVASGDKYVQPAPADKRLAVGGHSALARPLSASDNVMYLKDGALLEPGLQGNMLRVADEFITYGSFAKVGEEIVVSGLARARWGSTAVDYAAGDRVDRLQINQYGGAHGNIEIIDEIATRFSSIWNTTGIKAFSYDGLESASDGGWGSYGISRLVNGTLRQTEEKNLDGLISETSRMTSGAWDSLSRASWGEVASTSMDQVYINNAFYDNNFLPGMMGWIRISSSESMLSAESKLARAAGLNSGTGFQTSVGNLSAAQGNTTAILEAIKQWETARNIGAFSAGQMMQLRDQSTFWTLKVVEEGKSWTLQRLDPQGNAIGDAEPVGLGVPKFTTASLLSATQGVLYEQKVETNTVATTRFEVTSGSLPAGLKLNADTGGITGVPAAAGASQFTISAKNGAGLAGASAGYTLRVNAAAAPAALSLETQNQDGKYSVKVTLTNKGAADALTNVRLALKISEGWNVAASGTDVDDIAAGASEVVSYAIVPDTKAAARKELVDVQATAIFDVAQAKGAWVSAAASLYAPVTHEPLDNLALGFNNVGITNDSNPRPGNFDGSGNSYSQQALEAVGLKAGADVVHDGITFTWPSGVGVNNNLSGEATFKVAGAGAVLGFLGSAVGPQTGQAVVTYTDGTRQPFELSMNNWGGETVEDAVFDSSYRNTPGGPANHGYHYRVFYDSVKLLPGKQVYSVTTPKKAGMRLFAAAIGQKVAVTPAPVTFNDVSGTVKDTFSVPATAGVEYLVGGEAVAAGTHTGSGDVTVTARAAEGFILADGATAEWAFTFSAEPTTTPDVVDGGALTKKNQIDLGLDTKKFPRGASEVTLAGVTAGQWFYVYLNESGLGWHQAAADGTISVTTPGATRPGNNKLVLINGDGTLLGWTPLKVTGPPSS